MTRQPAKTEPTRLRVRVAHHGRSMEEAVRLILRDAVGRKPSSRDLASIIHAHFGPANDMDLQLPPREAVGCEPPSFIEPAAMSVPNKNVICAFQLSYTTAFSIFFTWLIYPASTSEAD